MPAFDNLWPRGAQSDKHTPAGHLVDGHSLHGTHCRRAGLHLHDGGTQFDFGGLRADPGQRCDGVVPPSLRGPDRVKARDSALRIRSISILIFGPKPAAFTPNFIGYLSFIVKKFVLFSGDFRAGPRAPQNHGSL